MSAEAEPLTPQGLRAITERVSEIKLWRRQRGPDEEAALYDDYLQATADRQSLLVEVYRLRHIIEHHVETHREQQRLLNGDYSE